MKYRITNAAFFLIVLSAATSFAPGTNNERLLAVHDDVQREWLARDTRALQAFVSNEMIVLSAGNLCLAA